MELRLMELAGLLCRKVLKDLQKQMVHVNSIQIVGFQHQQRKLLLLIYMNVSIYVPLTLHVLHINGLKLLARQKQQLLVSSSLILNYSKEVETLLMANVTLPTSSLSQKWPEHVTCGRITVSCYLLTTLKSQLQQLKQIVRIHVMEMYNAKVYSLIQAQVNVNL